MSAAMLKSGPKAEEAALPAWFCLEVLLHENVMIPWLGSYFVTKRFVVRNLCREVVGYCRKLVSRFRVTHKKKNEFPAGKTIRNKSNKKTW